MSNPSATPVSPLDAKSTLERAAQFTNVTGVRLELPASKLALHARALDVLKQAGVLRRGLQIAAGRLPTREAVLAHMAALSDTASAESFLRTVLDDYALAYAATALLLDDTFWSGPLSVPEARIVCEVLATTWAGPSVLRLYGVDPVRIHPDLSAHALASELREALVRDRALVLAGFTASGLAARQRVSATDWQSAIAGRLNERLRG